MQRKTMHKEKERYREKGFQCRYRTVAEIPRVSAAANWFHSNLVAIPKRDFERMASVFEACFWSLLSYSCSPILTPLFAWPHIPVACRTVNGVLFMYLSLLCVLCRQRE